MRNCSASSSLWKVTNTLPEPEKPCSGLRQAGSVHVACLQRGLRQAGSASCSSSNCCMDRLMTSEVLAKSRSLTPPSSSCCKRLSITCLFSLLILLISRRWPRMFFPRSWTSSATCTSLTLPGHSASNQSEICCCVSSGGTCSNHSVDVERTSAKPAASLICPMSLFREEVKYTIEMVCQSAANGTIQR